MPPRRRCWPRCARRCPTTSTWTPTPIDDLITDSAAYRMFLNAWWPPLVATDVLRAAGRPGRRRPGSPSGLLTRAEQAALAASYVEHADWSVADTALLDELVAILGPRPPRRRRTPTRRCSSPSGSRGVGAGDDGRPAAPDPPRRRSGRGRLRHLRPPAHRRDPGHHPDAVADAAPAGLAGVLDGRRRPGAELVARPGRGRARRPRADRHGAAPRVPAQSSTTAPRRRCSTWPPTVVQRAYPNADLPTAVRSTGIDARSCCARPRRRSSPTWPDILDGLTDEVPGTVGRHRPAVAARPPARRRAERGWRPR